MFALPTLSISAFFSICFFVLLARKMKFYFPQSVAVGFNKVVCWQEVGKMPSGSCVDLLLLIRNMQKNIFFFSSDDPARGQQMQILGYQVEIRCHFGLKNKKQKIFFSKKIFFK